MESTHFVINYKDDNISIIRFLSESNNQFNQRLNYIRKLEKNNINCNEIQNLSLIWYNIKFKKCKYNYEIENRVLSYDK